MSLLDDVNRLKQEALQLISKADSLERLGEIHVKYLGRKGAITSILKGLKDLSLEAKKSVGAAANTARAELEENLAAAKERFGKTTATVSFDPTLPGTSSRIGVIHLAKQVIEEMCQIFYGMGFAIARGPDIESDYYNFEALNFPPDHPARDMQDTFFVEGNRVLRTHTTPLQARVLEQQQPPIKIITPGLCFRNEAISSRAHVAFHQVDGFLVDEGVSMADLKGALVAFCKAFYGEAVKLRFRPSFFPFTEPSAEVDISCLLCGGTGCQLCQQTGWLEILGCGMIDPNVLDMAGIDSEKYTGYAFGIGVERTTMLKYRINDIRLFFNNDIRFLRQFK
ncbi:MAG: phenylalanine--tRNA ligase subunit alpha [Candidatus Zixiibacteriota bacterium]|nr:MAG: phenylalanine--tRNA ligase subunit alpha [candidate division Zixibacteria bacterium]